MSGARVVAVDVAPAALELASDLGAEICFESSTLDTARMGEAVLNATNGGVQVSIDAASSPATSSAC